MRDEENTSARSRNTKNSGAEPRSNSVQNAPGYCRASCSSGIETASGTSGANRATTTPRSSSRRMLDAHCLGERDRHDHQRTVVVDRRRSGQREGEPDHGEARSHAVGAELVAEDCGGGEAQDERIRPRLPCVRRGTARQQDERGDEAVPRARAPGDDGVDARAREEEAEQRRDPKRRPRCRRTPRATRGSGRSRAGGSCSTPVSSASQTSPIVGSCAKYHVYSSSFQSGARTIERADGEHVQRDEAGRERPAAARLTVAALRRASRARTRTYPGPARATLNADVPMSGARSTQDIGTSSMSRPTSSGWMPISAFAANPGSVMSRSRTTSSRYSLRLLETSRTRCPRNGRSSMWKARLARIFGSG